MNACRVRDKSWEHLVLCVCDTVCVVVLPFFSLPRYRKVIGTLVRATNTNYQKKNTRVSDIARKKREEYKEHKKEVRKIIAIAKRRKWGEMCEDLNQDVFGQGYKIVKNQLKVINLNTIR